eukprot:UN00598
MVEFPQLMSKAYNESEIQDESDEFDIFDIDFDRLHQLSDILEKCKIDNNDKNNKKSEGLDTDSGVIELGESGLKTFDNTQDSLMTLISVKRLKYLRKYTDGNYKPSEDSRVKKAMQSVVTKNIENSDILPL